QMTTRLFFQNANRKRPAGSIEVVRRATVQQMRDFEATYWVPNNAAIVVSGDVKPEDAFRLVEQYFGDWPRAAADPLKSNLPPPSAPLPRSEGAIVTSPVS